MKKKRPIIFAALVTLALAAVGWRLAAPASAQDAAGKAAVPGQPAEKRGGASRVMITIGTPGDDDLPGPGVLGRPLVSDILDLAAKALGISREQLVEEQQAGKSLEEIATAHGTTKQAVIDGIEADMRAEFTAHVEAAVADGKLTRAQADKLVAKFKIEIELDDLPSGDLALGTGTVARRGLFGFLQGDGRDEGEVFTLPVPPPGVDGEDWELPLPGRLAEEDVLIPALPGANGAEPHIIALAGRGGLDPATFDKVKGVLQGAVTAGRLTQDEADQAIEQLDPTSRPAIKLFRWHDDSDEEDDEPGDDANKSRRSGATSPARRRLVESL